MRSLDPSKAYRLFYPQVPVVVASMYRGTIAAMPATAAIPLSNNPPRAGFASAPDHSTYKTTIASGAFSLSWLDKRFARVLARLARPLPSGLNDKLSWAGVEYHSSQLTKTPIIDAALATLECSVSSTHTMGDHDLVVGDIRSASASDDFQTYWQFNDYRPILYVGSEGGFKMLD